MHVKRFTHYLLRLVLLVVVGMAVVVFFLQSGRQTRSSEQEVPRRAIQENISNNKTHDVRQEPPRRIPLWHRENKGGKKSMNISLNVHAPNPGGRSPRVLCWVMTDPSRLHTTRPARDTWTRRCDKALFMSSRADPAFPTVGLPGVKGGRGHIASKCKAAWTYIYEHHINEYDYFVKADPDTYMVVENLKAYLADYDPEKPEFFGHIYRASFQTYMAGGPGVVLSRAAVRRLVTKAFYNPTIGNKCMPDGEGEDWKICRCLEKVGAKPVDTVDEKGRERFLVFGLSYLYHGTFPGWYLERDRALEGKNCCSDYPIGFHYISSQQFPIFEYFLYHAKVKSNNKNSTLWT